MATREAIFNLRVNTNGADKTINETTQELNKLDKSIDNVGQSSEQTAKDVYNLGAKFEDVYGELQPLSSRLGEIEDRMYELALAGKSNTEEFQVLRAEVVKYRNTILDVDAQVDALADTGSRLNGAMQLGEGVLSGYQAFIGVTALLGEDQEQYMETLVKLQAVQGAVNGLQAVHETLNKRSAFMVQANMVATWAYAGAQKGLAIAIGTATGAAKAFRLALIATGLGAIVVGLGLLIANFDKVTAAVGKAVTWFKSLGEGVKLALSIIFPFIGAIRLAAYALEEMGIIDSDETKQMKANADARAKAIAKERQEKRNAINEEIADNERRQKSITSTYDWEIEKAKAAGKDVTKLEREKRNEMRKTLEEQIKNLEISMQLNSTNAAEMLRIFNKVKDARMQLLDLERKEELATISEGTAARQKAAKSSEEAEKKALEEKEKMIERERLLRDYFIESIDDENVRKLVQLQEQHKREREELEKKYEGDEELMKQLETKQFNERMALEKEEISKLSEQRKTAETQAAEELNKSRKAQLQAELLQLAQDSEMRMQKQIELWQLERDLALENEKITTGEKLLIQEEYNQKVRELEAETKKKSAEQRLQEIQAAIHTFQQGIEVMTSISDAAFAIRMRNVKKGSEEEERIAKRQFQINKAFQLGQAIANTALAVTAALSAGGNAAKIASGANFVEAATAGIIGAANIAKIAATQFNSTSSGSVAMGGSSGSMATPNTPQQMSNAPEIETTLTNSQTPPPQQVYVLEADITNTQNRLKDIAVRSTI